MEEQVIDTMGKKLGELLQLDDPDEFKLNLPTAIWTYTLNESGEELLKKSFIETALDENELDDYDGYDYDEDEDEESGDESTEEAGEPAVNNNESREKKGFFAKLFGKK